VPRPSKTEQEVGFIRAFWDEVREMEADYNGYVHVTEIASKRPGVLDITLTFEQVVGEDNNLLDTCRYKYLYPNSMLHTYGASKWIAARALRQLVEDVAAARPKAKKNRPSAKQE